MNLAQVIHQRWAAATALDDLLPASRVYTGLSVDPAAPYAVISKRSDRVASRHNDGSALDTVGVRMEIYHHSRDDAVAVIGQVKAAFDRSDFALSGSDRVINMQRTDDSESQDDDGLWRLAIDFNCTIYLATGA